MLQHLNLIKKEKIFEEHKNESDLAILPLEKSVFKVTYFIEKVGFSSFSNLYTQYLYNTIEPNEKLSTLAKLKMVELQLI